jgi:PhzF family phenazine biosynthesis protein
MRLRLWQVDAFTDRVFAGNPAAVVPLPAWLPDPVLRAIAAENNLSETAFLVREEGGWRIRWFTPAVEVELCGHATLASAFVVLTHLAPGAGVTFQSQSGPLTVARGAGGLLEMTFPRLPGEPVEPSSWPGELSRALGRAPREALRSSRKWMAVLDRAEDVRALRPDLDAVAALDLPGLIVTAPGDGEADFVSRYFGPKVGIPEDPVTGSAHCTLAPYWAARLGKRRLLAHQVSARGGRLECEDTGDAVRIAGRAAQYLVGEIDVPA